jgi:uncharacterized protein YneF (UPF0154 family)
MPIHIVWGNIPLQLMILAFVIFLFTGILYFLTFGFFRKTQKKELKHTEPLHKCKPNLLTV